MAIIETDWARGIAGTRPDKETDKARGIAGTRPDYVARGLAAPIVKQVAITSSPVKLVSPPKITANVTHNFVDLPFEEPKSEDEQTRWKWEPIGFVHKVQTVVLIVNAEVQISKNNVLPPTRQQWKVGFVQNLLSDTLSYKFKGSSAKTITLNKKLLDQKPKFNEPWQSPEQHPTEGVTRFDTFDIGIGDITISLSTTDVPCKLYHNYKGGDRNLGQLEWVKNSMSFGLWVLARPVNAPAQELNSYIIVSAHEWSLTESLTVVRGPKFVTDALKVVSGPQPRFYEARPLVDLPVKPQCSFKKMDPVREPVLTGPIASEYQWQESREIIG